MPTNQVRWAISACNVPSRATFSWARCMAEVAAVAPNRYIPNAGGVQEPMELSLKRHVDRPATTSNCPSLEGQSCL